MRNRFFHLTVSMASHLVGKPARLITLAARLLARLDSKAMRNLKNSVMTEKLKELGRLVSAYSRGHYRHIPVKAMITVAAAILYFLNPFDLVPDAIPGLGLTDDLAVLTWVCKNLSEELTAFSDWKRSTAS